MLPLAANFFFFKLLRNISPAIYYPLHHSLVVAIHPQAHTPPSLWTAPANCAATGLQQFTTALLLLLLATSFSSCCIFIFCRPSDAASSSPSQLFSGNIPLLIIFILIFFFLYHRGLQLTATNIFFQFPLYSTTLQQRRLHYHHSSFWVVFTAPSGIHYHWVVFLLLAAGCYSGCSPIAANVYFSTIFFQMAQAVSQQPSSMLVTAAAGLRHPSSFSSLLHSLARPGSSSSSGPGCRSSGSIFSRLAGLAAGWLRSGIPMRQAPLPNNKLSGQLPLLPAQLSTQQQVRTTTGTNRTRRTVCAAIAGQTAFAQPLHHQPAPPAAGTRRRRRFHRASGSRRRPSPPLLRPPALQLSTTG